MLSNSLLDPVNCPSTPTFTTPRLVDDSCLGKVPTQLERTVEFSSGAWTHDNTAYY